MTSRPDPDRRDFLKWAGFSLAALALPGCGRAPEHEAVPFLDKPEAVTPGRSIWYATLCGACEAGCGLLAKYRDGRPIKLEGNPAHPLSRGGTCAAGQAHLLSLYDSRRFVAPSLDGATSTWDAVDERVRAALAAARRSGKGVRLLTRTVNGPTARSAIAAFLADVPDGRHVMVDALSAAARLDAYERVLGRRMLPRPRLENARVLVGVDADFLGTWIAPVEYTHAYQAARRLDERGAPFCRHVQIESRLSLTGCAADRRHGIRPSQRAPILAALAIRVAQAVGEEAPWSAPDVEGFPTETLDEIAADLLSAPSLLLCGTNRLEEQTLVAWINHLLGNHGGTGDDRTLDVERHSLQALGDDRALAALLADMEAGRVGVLVVAGCNPVYDLPDTERVRAALAKVDLVVSTAALPDETSALAHAVCPEPHPLETWHDAEPVAGTITVGQPALSPLGDTRALVEGLAAWRSRPARAFDIMRDVWRAEVLPRAAGAGAFEVFWARAVHDGYATVAPRTQAPRAFDARAVVRSAPGEGAEEGATLVLYPKVGPGDGRHAHNPWLQELPDPVSKISWDNYAVLGAEDAARLGAATGDVIEIADGTTVVTVPALVQPGQPRGVVALALGYGRLGTDRFADAGPSWIESRPTVEEGATVGARASGFVSWDGGYRLLERAGVRLRRTGGSRALASSQLHHRLEEPAHLARPGDGPRPIAQETTLAAWREDPSAGSHASQPAAPLWDDDHAYTGHHWAMAIDLSRCTGCSACVVACQAENNIPVVGQDEMRRQRDMHWMRIDRYFQGDGADASAIYQPMLCQQCDNAPCETVCPVLATVHSSEGLNQQVYNRCVGTRYCSNNCPYKVRRFNWFDYRREDRRQNMVLNPDVTIRSRGVMEKCTFCVQRIQDAKAEAKREGRPLADGDVTPACVQACPAGAIVFGDDHDPKSRVVGQARDGRSYRVLEDLGVDPSVHYLRRVRDRQGRDQRHG